MKFQHLWTRFKGRVHVCVFARVCVHVYTVFDLVMVTNLSLCLSQITLWLHSSIKTDAANRDPTLDPKLDAEE